MNRTQSPTGGRTTIFGSELPEARRSRITPGRLHGRAGQLETFADHKAFDMLEQRQMLFALTPGFNQGFGAGLATFGYAAPFLIKNVPAFVEPLRTVFNFDYTGSGQFQLNNPEFLDTTDQNDPNVPPEQLRVDRAGFTTGPFPNIIFLGHGQTDEDGELTMPLAPAGQANRTITFSHSGPNQVGQRLLRAFEFVVIPSAPQQQRQGANGGLTNIPDSHSLGNTAAPFNITEQVRIELLLNGVVVNTFDEVGTDQDLSDQAFDNNTDQPESFRFRLARSGNLPDFNQVRFSRIGGNVEFDILEIVTEQAPGMFAGWIDQRTFGARVRIAGPLNGANDPAVANPPPGSNPDLFLTQQPFRRTLSEIFDDDTGALNRRLDTPTTFASGVRISHTDYNAGNAPQVVAGVGGGADRAINFQLVGTQTVSFSFRDALGNARPMTQFSFATTDGAATDLGAGTQIELLRNGTVVRTYVAADLAAISDISLADPTQRLYLLDTLRSSDNFDVDATVDDATLPILANFAAAFDEVRISREGGAGTDAGGIQIDRVSPFAPAMVEFFDLYGRPMRPTIEVLATDLNPIPLMDANDDGVPDFNDGIGRILVSNGGSTTNLTMLGGEIEFSTDVTIGRGFLFRPVDNTVGNFNSFEDDAGFGFALDPNSAEPQVIGLPLGPGSIIIGSPFIRNNATPVDYHGVDPRDATRQEDTPSTGPLHWDGTPNDLTDNPPVTGADLPLSAASDFSSNNTGIFVAEGTAMGNVTVHGAVIGQLDFGSSVRLISVGTLLGSINVRGDVGALAVAENSGMYFLIDNANNQDDAGGIVSVGSTINILRTVQSIYFGGRNTARITVFGDQNNPNLGRIQYSAYTEREVIPGIQPGTPEFQFVWLMPEGLQDVFRVGLNQTMSDEQRFLERVAGGAAVMLFGDRGYRNDTLNGAEYIGHPGSFVTVSGSLGVINPLQTEDQTDVYAFGGRAGQGIIFDVALNPNGQSANQFVFEIVDSNGIVVATAQSPVNSRNRLPSGTSSIRVQYTPRSDDVYYMRLSIQQLDGSANSQNAYTIAVNGMAATGAGMVSIAGNSTALIDIRTSLGFLRTGAGLVGDDGTDQARGATIESIETDDDFQEAHGMPLLIGGELLQFWAGTDLIASPTIIINGNLGSFRVGLSAATPGQGDVAALDLRVGGRLGYFEVQGDLSGDRDNYHTATPGPGGPVTVQTGRIVGADGSIDQFIVNGVTYGDSTTIRMFGSQSRLSTLEFRGGILLAAPTIEAPDGGTIGSLNSPVIPQSRPGVPLDPNAFRLPILFDVPLNLTASSGVTYSIRITGGIASRNSFGSVLLLPIVGAPGASLARIDVSLLGGANLLITTSSTGKLEIGAIAVTTGQGGGTATNRSSDIMLGGIGEIDVSGSEGITQIAGPGGGNIGTLANLTVGGDILVADLQGVRDIVIAGNLGVVNDPNRSVFLQGRAIETAFGLASVVNGPIAIPQTFMGDDWNGLLNPIAADAVGPGYGGRIGAPINPFLTGVVVRTGNVNRVVVNGAVGDVMLVDFSAGNGQLTTLIANADNITGATGFDGIVGNVFANNLINVNVGQGMRGTAENALPESSIVAIGHIGTIGGRNATISGLIIAGSEGAAPRGLQTGINAITLNGGLLDSATIFIGEAHSYFANPLTFVPRGATRGDVPVYRGNIRGINLNNASIFRSDINAQIIGAITINNGFFDGSVVSGVQTVGQIRASGFRNSTRTGEIQEYHQNQVFAGISVGGIAAGTGDISDFVVLTNGDLIGGITARNIIRSEFDIRQRMGNISATNDIRTSTFSVGNLAFLRAGGDIRSSTVAVAGPIGSLTSGGEITNTSITSTGIDGRINSISAGGSISGTITSAGPISSITSSRGSISGVITTTDASDGTLTSINAGTDLGATFNIAKNIVSIRAGGNIGRRQAADGSRDIIDVAGTIGTITATGQLYADVRGGSTIQSITIGRVAALPANDQVGDPIITAFGRIASVAITGDFNGSIVSYSGGIGSVRITNGSFRIGNDDNLSGTIDADERNRIEARDNNIDAVTISNGSLFGDILAPQGDIRSVSVTGTGPFGRLGVDPNLSLNAAVTGDLFRNQLPPGTPNTAGLGGTAGFDGPNIRAGRDIVSVTSSGPMFEVGIFAGRNVTTISAGGGINTDARGVIAGSSFIAAGEQVTTVTSRGNTRGLTIVAGVSSLGGDDRIGGAAANADVLRTGKVTTVSITGNSDTVAVSAGVNAGSDGLYNTADGDASETAVPGLSSIGSFTVTGTIVATTAFGDLSAGTGTAAITRSVGALPADARTFTGSTAGFVPITTANQAITTTFGENATVTFSGAGSAFWDAANNRIVLINTTLASVLRIAAVSPTTTLTNFGIVSNDDASLGTLVINAQLRSNTGSDTADRNTRLFIDGNVSSITVGNTVITADAGLLGSGIFFVGGDLTTATIGTAGTLAAPAAANQFRLQAQNNISTVTVNGNFGTSIASRIDANNLTTLTVNGDFRGVVSASRNLSTVRATGQLNGGRIRAGGDITSITLGSTAVNGSNRISAGGNITTVTINGDAPDTTIYAGTDLGTDGTFGGVGSAADSTTNGNITSVTVRGNFNRSDVAAGVARGTDGFVNTGDDIVADGLSTITSVTITGGAVGSPVNSQRYAVISNGGTGTVRLGATTLATTIGNFGKVTLSNRPVPIQITDLQVSPRGPRLYTARITFNQNLDAATIAGALSISEIRSAAGIVPNIPLVAGTDYTTRFDPASRTLFVDFAEAVTARNLVGNNPGGSAGPGVFRFELDAAVLRGATTNARLDGNSDGAVAGNTDDFSVDALVGDAGDRVISGRTFLTATDIIDFYGPASLDLLMDGNRSPDLLPDANRPYILRGTLGDHPDALVSTFGLGGDVDVYTITLRAGQILNLSAIRGPASEADLAILDSQNNPVWSVYEGLVGGAMQVLGSQDPDATGTSLLVINPGTYTIAILQPIPTQAGLQTDIAGFPPLPLFPNFDLTNPTAAPSPDPIIGMVGDYQVTIEIIDDGDNGFAAPAPALVTADIVVAEAPVPLDFRGGDNVFDTADDLPFDVGNDVNPLNPQFIFQLFAGADNLFDTGDDLIIGSNGAGTFAVRTAGPNNTFGDGDDVFTVTRTLLAGAAPVDPDGAGAQLDVPVPNDFRGVDNTFNTTDDLATVSRTSSTGGPNFVYFLLPGNDGVRGTADDIVSGSTGQGGFVSTRAAGVNNTFGDGDDVVRLLSDGANGSNITNANLIPSNFAGVDNVLGTADDLASISIGGYTFTLSRGTNNRIDGNGTIAVRSDDVVTGTNGATGRFATITSTRRAGTDGIFGTADDVFTSTANAAIGIPGQAGVTRTGAADMDVYQLNDGQTITPGTRVRATLRVTEIGGNLGQFGAQTQTVGAVPFETITDTRGLVQLALFDTTNATSITNANLVAAASKVLAIGAQAGTTVTDGSTTYGFDALGDFFMEFAMPSRIDAAGQPGTFALYVQGVVRSDYQLEITTSGTAALPAGPQTQNILIESAGGVIDWLEANPYIATQLAAADVSLSGFTGVLGANSTPAQQYFTQELVTRLQAIFTAAGINVVISSNAADFEGQDFSTVYLAGSQPPLSFINNGTFGANEHVDLFNADRNDTAVVYLTSLNALGNAPGQAGADNFINQLTAATGRRIGELLGIRSTGAVGAAANTDIMAANSASLTLPAGGVFEFNNASRPVTRPGGGRVDTQFFLGNQLALPLLQRIFGL